MERAGGEDTEKGKLSQTVKKCRLEKEKGVGEGDMRVLPGQVWSQKQRPSIVCIEKQKRKRGAR